MAKFIFNTTFCMEDSDTQVFLSWLKAEFLPALTSNGMASDPVLSKVLAATELGEGQSLSLQLRVADDASLEKWQSAEWPRLEASVVSKFGRRVLLFSTVMEIL